MERTFVGLGALLAFIGVAAGAFGAHLLKGKLASEMMEVFELAVRYQMLHALALLGVGYWVGRSPGTAAHLSGWLLAAGTLVFSGSLYLLSLTGQRAWGAVTPFGGVALLLGWACLIWAVWLKTTGNRPPSGS